MSAEQRVRQQAGRGREDGTALTVILVVLLVVTGAGLYWTPKPTTRRHLANTATHLESELLLKAPKPVGTSGAGQVLATDAEAPAAVIRDIETITGSIDGHELVGRRVDLRVPVVAAAGTIGFWVGPNDNRVLVVTRAQGEARRSGRRDADPDADRAGAAPPPAGEQVAVSGVIKPLPPEAAAQWKLTESDRAALADRTIFILVS